MSSSLRQTINKTMKRKRGGATFAARALSSMTKVVSSSNSNSTPKPLSDEETKKKEQEAKEIEEKQKQCASKNKTITETLEKTV